MKKLILILLIPALFSACKKDSGTQKEISYSVTGYSYNITVVKGSTTVSTATIPSGNNIAQTTKTYSFTANKGDKLDFNYTNSLSLKIVISTNGSAGPTINVGQSSSDVYNFTVE